MDEEYESEGEISIADIEEVEEIALTIEDLAATPNIASILEETQLSTIGEDCKRGFEIDEASLEGWMEKHTHAMALALQKQDEKTYPWEGASNIIYPLVTVGALQFNARALPAIIPDNNVVKCRVNGDDSGVFEALRGPDGMPVMNPQTNQPEGQWIMPPGAKAGKAARVQQHMNWQLLDESDEWADETDTLLLYLPIAGCAFRRWWFDQEKNRPCSRVITASNLIINYEARSLESAPRISEKFYLYPYEIVEKIRSGEYFYDGEDPYADFGGQDDASPDDEEAAVCLIEQHTRLDLDDDGYPEPYTVIFYPENGKVLKIVPRYVIDDVVMDEMGDVVRIPQLVEYVKYDFIPNPEEGFYGIGFGWLLGPINEQVNTTINQLNDAAHLNNMPMGFVARGLRVHGGDMRFGPGEFKQVDSAGGNLRDNLYQLRLEPPSPVLFQLLGMMINAGRDISSVKDIMTGDMSRNIAPTTALTLVEQGTTQFNSIFKRVHRSLKKEMKLLFEINARTIDEKYQRFLDLNEELAEVSRSDYDPESFDVTPVTDPNMAARQLRSAKAQSLMQVSQTFPGMLNQQKILALILEAMDIENPTEYILPPPPPPEPTPDQQAKLMRAETDQMRAETDREAKGYQALRDLMQALELQSRAMLNEARAGTEAENLEIENFISNLNAMKDEVNGLVGTMAGGPANA